MNEEELTDIRDAFETALSHIGIAEAELESVGFIEDYGWGFDEQKAKLEKLIRECDDAIGEIHYAENMEVMKDSERW